MAPADVSCDVSGDVPDEASAAALNAPAVLAVEVIYCAARGQVDCTPLILPAGATVADALLASGLLRRHPGLDPAGSGGGVGVWGRRVDPGRVLQAADRVEVYRPLRIEPKEARRQRQQRQRRTKAAAGLAAKRTTAV